ncbi:OmpA family protein [Lutimonas saemankumensis]|uniref:OmpA family protein n=1 Tax=Lutimonas saemankumensis TaxID=483016 RepID=UPI001CD77095|nr:OmpA family protein [Lutimonas saemankumensis]MCA0933198.1 OmpA family protein [Lutimonas saemankumensis]
MKRFCAITILLLSMSVFPQLTAAEYKVKSLEANSENGDFGTTFYGKDKIVFSSSRKNGISNKRWEGNDQPFLDLYIGNVEPDGEITRVRPFSSAVNSKYHDAMVAFTPDLKEIYFTSNNYMGGKVRSSNLKIFRASLTSSGVRNNIMTLPINNDKFSTGHPFVSKDGKKLYYISDMPGGMGGTDIYEVTINKGHYGAPRNLGPTINSKYKEYTPYVDGDILYFSSNRPGGEGGFDIYMTKLDGSIEEPINLGKPMNSKGDDISFIIDKTTQRGYFSSNRRGGKGDDDIYSFKELTVNPICDQVVQGKIVDEITGQPLSNAFATIYNSKGEKLRRIETLKNGEFFFKVECDATYKIEGDKFGYFQADSTLVTNRQNAFENKVILKLDEKEFLEVNGKEVLNVRSIEFELNEANILESSYDELSKVARLMEKFPEMIIQFGSHTDSRGGDGYNMWLSQKRASSTVSYLIGIGVDSRRITGKGFGETKLVNKCSNGVKCTELEHRQNKRTEFVVIKK